KNGIEFLKFLVKYIPHDSNNRKKYIILNPKVIHGIAAFINVLMNKKPNLSMEFIFNKIVSKVDWTHDNIDFKKYNIPYSKSTERYNFSNGVRSIKGINNYLLDFSIKRGVLK